MKMLRIISVAILVAIALAAGDASADEVVVRKFRNLSRKCGRARGAAVTVQYRGEGSRLIRNSCFQATFEDGSSSDATGGDFNDLRMSDNGKTATRTVCFCESRYKISEIAYRCQDPR